MKTTDKDGAMYLPEDINIPSAEWEDKLPKRTGKWMVDPTLGWRWGFPKGWDADKYPDLNEWLVKEGLPREVLEELIKQESIYRIWKSE